MRSQRLFRAGGPETANPRFVLRYGVQARGLQGLLQLGFRERLYLVVFIVPLKSYVDGGQRHDHGDQKATING